MQNVTRSVSNSEPVARYLYVTNDIVSNCLFYDAHSVPDSVPSRGRITGERRLEGKDRDLTEVFFRQLRGPTEENHYPLPHQSGHTHIAAEITTGQTRPEY